MNRYFIFSSILFLSTTFMSCEKQSNEEVIENSIAIIEENDSTIDVNSRSNIQQPNDPIEFENSLIEDDFIIELNNINCELIIANAGVNTDTAYLQTVVVPHLLSASKEFLEINDIDYSEYFEEDDMRIAALALSLIDFNDNLEVKSRTSAGGCFLEALGIKDLVMSGGKKLATKQVVKIVAKTLLKRAIPFLGWGLFALDYINCIIE